MPSYYQILNVDKKASFLQIKQAYRRSLLTCHPDKVKGKERQFLELQEAWLTLSNPDKRRVYDRDEARRSLKYFLSEKPDEYDHYAYYNKLFDLNDEEKIAPGQIFDEPKREHLYIQIYRVGDILNRELNTYTSPKAWLNNEQRKRVNFLEANLKKMSLIENVLLSNAMDRALYDVRFGIYHNPQVQEIVHQMGGKNALMQAIRRNPNIDFVMAVLALYESQCLTPKNFQNILSNPIRFAPSFYGDIYTQLNEANLLNQSNINLIERFNTHLKGINCGIARLKLANRLQQPFFEDMVYAGEFAESHGCNVEDLKIFNLFTEENYQIFVRYPSHFSYFSILNPMKLTKELTPEKSDVLMWNGPNEMRDLNHAINQMFAYGLYFLSIDVPKGKSIMHLALDLKSDLKTYISKSAAEQRLVKIKFEHQFYKKLHSLDAMMSIHRQYWKVIVANVLIGLSGIGLFVLGVNYLRTGAVFFQQTTREKLVMQIEHSAMAFCNER